METILSIEEGTWTRQEGTNYRGDPWMCSYAGYTVTTDQQAIRIGVSDGQSCCEQFGYIASDEDVQRFVGAQLLGIRVVDTALNQRVLEETNYLDAGDAMFIDLLTDRDILQLAVYNGHNGYYGHTGVLISRDLNEEKGL